ncbi:ABC transporter permease [Rhodococcus erythropolis]|uniref:MlaE family ABC transporter permease n=1 Tax=Rhodococcus erythropolis TaxID=1833 RepID=UPI00210E2B7F|nr:ABC transporter permease [Rhodococcus erythropolis]MCQ4127659.1 ABC transporter permease [Rhodococcus erythropolis]
MTSTTRTLGETVLLTLRAVRYLVTDIPRGKHSWHETVRQAWFIVSVTALPSVLVALPFGIIVSVQVGSLTQQIGATSMTGAATGLGVIRQGAPMATALLLAGAAGSAIAADLASRTVREEIDAMRVMGIDPVQRAVAPRIVAMLFVAPLLCILIIFMGLMAGYMLNVGFQGGSSGGFVSSLASFTSTADLYLALVKSWLFGLIVVAVACQRGLSARGGPKGVAEAVNAAVVVGIVTAFVVNVALTQAAAMFLPQKVG